MGEITNINKSNENEIIELTGTMLSDVHKNIDSNNTLRIPIAELATLGSGVASLIPALNTVTQTTSIAMEGVYQLANAGIGDTLKVAKNGNFWGAFKTADGASKFAQLKPAGPMSATTTTVAPINSATMMMAVALFSIEKDLRSISEMERQILLFLENEKEAEVEADVETLSNIVTKYKLNWDNEHFVDSNHKMVLDIQRTARKNMNLYQKEVSEMLKDKQFLVVNNKVNSKLIELKKKFKYYRLSLYTFSLASFLEIMLSGNFKEEYIIGIKTDIESKSLAYREIFEQCSIQLEKMGKSALEVNVVKGLGNVESVAGKAIGKIPSLNKGIIDEFLQDKGDNLKSNALGMENNAVRSFAILGNPGTGVFLDKMGDMVEIFNHTSQICFDKNEIYLLEE